MIRLSLRSTKKSKYDTAAVKKFAAAVFFAKNVLKSGNVFVMIK